jgi:hypothetical protein
MNLKRRLIGVGIATPVLMLLSTASVFAADPTGASTCNSTNLLAKVGIDVVHLNANLCGALGQLASVYITFMNLLVVLAMILFTWVSGKHVVHALLSAHEAPSSEINAGSDGTTTQGLILESVKNVLQSGLITLVILFVVINGANLLLEVAYGSSGLFSVDASTGLAGKMGIFAGLTASVQLWASMAVILLGTVIAAWKAISVLKEDKFDTYGKSDQFAKTKVLIKDMGAIAFLTVFAFIVIRYAPSFVIQVLSGVQSLGTSGEVPILS